MNSELQPIARVHGCLGKEQLLSNRSWRAAFHGGGRGGGGGAIIIIDNNHLRSGRAALRQGRGGSDLLSREQGVTENSTRGYNRIATGGIHKHIFDTLVGLLVVLQSFFCIPGSLLSPLLSIYFNIHHLLRRRR
ncbi:unnamed protein product, partial [Linum tenue]